MTSLTDTIIKKNREKVVSTSFLITFLFLSLFALLLFSSCESDVYETGDGEYSYLRADFGEVYTAGATQVIKCVTDEGEQFSFTPQQIAKWASRGDTLYRALVYHHRVEQGTTSVYALAQIPVLTLLQSERPDTFRTDPLTLESAWVSTNGKYLNIGYAVKTGASDGIDARQILGVFYETKPTGADDEVLRLRLTHAQNGVPEYYTARGFMSIPLQRLSAHKVSLNVHTYGGDVTRYFEW